MRPLEEMSVAELWELFPITLCNYDARWSFWADEEMALLSECLAGLSRRITHVGSTAVPGMISKPIVDILIEVDADADWTPVKSRLLASGYICMSESSRRISFNKGYTPRGYSERVFHVHVVRSGDNDEIAFRDYLRRHPDAAREYGRLKIRLLEKYGRDRDGYTAAKSDFVAEIVGLARSGS